MRLTTKFRSEIRKLRQRWSRRPYGREVTATTEHIHGVPVHPSVNDLVVVALMRDAAGQVGSFLQHHLRLGARSVVLLDNGSTDASIDIARQFDQAVVLQCQLPYATHKYAMKHFLCDRFGRGCWCLIADIDEHFDYPYSNEISLEAFLRYLNKNRFTAVVAQMLDLFPAGPADQWPDATATESTSCFYDLSAVHFQPYQTHRTNRLDGATPFHWSGGIRKSAFAMTNGPSLTKHPLLFPSAGARPTLKSSHECRHARIADVTCLLKHYKFNRNFFEQCRVAVAQKNYFNESSEYRDYLKMLEDFPSLVLKESTAERFTSTGALAESGILQSSPGYRNLRQSNLCRVAA